MSDCLISEIYSEMTDFSFNDIFGRGKYLIRVFIILSAKRKKINAIRISLNNITLCFSVQQKKIFHFK